MISSCDANISECKTSGDTRPHPGGAAAVLVLRGRARQRVQDERHVEDEPHRGVGDREGGEVVQLPTNVRTLQAPGHLWPVHGEGVSDQEPGPHNVAGK